MSMTITNLSSGKFDHCMSYLCKAKRDQAFSGREKS